jgi:hypothetical protein
MSIHKQQRPVNPNSSQQASKAANTVRNAAPAITDTPTVEPESTKKGQQGAADRPAGAAKKHGRKNATRRQRKV